MTKIISGCQTGADEAGLRAAEFLGIPTGGTMAAGHAQSVGNGRTIGNPGLAERFGLSEGRRTTVTRRHGTYQDVYLDRTIRNARDADGTVWFGRTEGNGFKVTTGLKAQHHKPKPLINPTPQELLDWVIAHDIGTLNVAGNREWTKPGVSKTTYDTVVAALGPARI